MENMTHLVEAPPVLCICSNMSARVLQLDAECHIFDEAKVGVTVGTLAVVHTGEKVFYTLTAPHIA